MGGGTVVPGDANPLEGLPAPAVATSVSYVDGVTGGNVLVLPLESARLLAAAMMGLEQPEEPDAPELSELELSAVAEAANQMMASAAGATSAVLDTAVEIGPLETRTFATAADAAEAYARTPHAVRVSFTVSGEPCRLVQLVPNAFVVRMTRALDELGAQIPDAGSAPAGPRPSQPSLAGIPVRVWAELGRTQMPSAQVVGMPPGAVVELDRQADDAIDLYVNGTPFATGRLMVVDGSDWAVRIETSSRTRHPILKRRWPDGPSPGSRRRGVHAQDGQRLPQKDGVTALKEIIELDPSTRVVMCSALGQEGKVLESIKAGARDFVVKPFQADRVLEAVGKALA